MALAASDAMIRAGIASLLEIFERSLGQMGIKRALKLKQTPKTTDIY